MYSSKAIDALINKGVSWEKMRSELLSWIKNADNDSVEKEVLSRVISRMNTLEQYMGLN